MTTPPTDQGPSSAPPKNRTALIVVAGLVAVLVVALVVVLVASAGDPDDADSAGGASTTASPDPTVPDPTATTTPPPVELPQPVPPEGGGDIGDVEVGDCINLTGSETDAEATGAECGTEGSNFTVVSLVAAPSGQCPQDINGTFSQPGEGGRTLCLDYDWQPGVCYEASPEDVARIDCGAATDPDKSIVRFIETLQDTDDDADCDSLGLVYSERRFVACFEEVTGG